MNTRTHSHNPVTTLGATLAVLTCAFVCGTSLAADPLPQPSDASRPIQAVPFDLADDSWFDEEAARAAAMMIGPTPCNSCDPLDLDNPLSPNYDPTILAIYQEDDLLPPPEGPGVATCNGLGVTGPFWAGANDQCWGPATASGRNIANIDTQIPALVPGAHYSICGQAGRINTSGFTGDPNNPGGALKVEDADVYELHIPRGAFVRFTGYFQDTQVRAAVVFNLDLNNETGTFGQLRDCTDRYGLYLEWTPMQSSVACADSVLDQYLYQGYWYILVDPLSAAPQGQPGNQLCEYWYNIEIEVFDAEGACCSNTESGFVCQDGLVPDECDALTSGNYMGVGSTCAEVVCPGHPCCLGGGCVDHFASWSCAVAGGVYKPEAESCATAGCDPPRACCLDSGSGFLMCQDGVTSLDCAELDGISFAPGTTCATVTCPGHPCCLGPNCVEPSNESACASAGGTYKPEAASCATAGCTPTGACCFSCTSTVAAPCPDPSGPVVGCSIQTSAQCAAARGFYVGNNTTCSQGIGGPCDCAGDINGDGNCNTSDFNILAGSFGQGNPNCRTHAQGDLNCDGIVNTADFNILAGSFGCTRN